MKFSSSIWANKTTVSFVFPMVNFTEPLDYDDSNEVSIFEALQGLVDASSNVPTGNPEDALIADWAYQFPMMYTLSTMWPLRILASTAYITEPTDDQYFAWTDIAPNNLPGDFEGDGDVDAADAAEFDAFVALRDGDPDYDMDGDPNNGILVIPPDPPHCGPWPANFCLYDRNGNGRVEPGDSPLLPLLPGDIDTDGDVDADDLLRLAPLLAGPSLTALPPGADAGDFQVADQDADGDVDLRDFSVIQQHIGA